MQNLSGVSKIQLALLVAIPSLRSGHQDRASAVFCFPGVRIIV
jgi:hypothetical protein